MSGVVSGLLDLLFPPRCPFCHRVVPVERSGFCAQCQKTLPWTQEAETEQIGETFRVCVSPLWYEGDVRESFPRYKFKGRQGYAKVYGTLMAQCVQDHLAGQYDGITWVPLSEERRRERGYDQAMLLALAVALQLNDVAVETLKKRRNAQAQSSLHDAAARRENVRDNYEVTDPELVEGKRILLIDDVVTTGATLSECAETLKKAGAADVVCATLARTRKEKE